jgi:hypothetical protein
MICGTVGGGKSDGVDNVGTEFGKIYGKTVFGETQLEQNQSDGMMTLLLSVHLLQPRPH